MLELPDLTPEHFEILVMRELRKVGLEISGLRIHRRTMLPEPDEGYLLEVKGVVRGAGWERRVLIACRRQQRPIVAAEVELLKDHAPRLRKGATHERAATAERRDGRPPSLRKRLQRARAAGDPARRCR